MPKARSTRKAKPTRRKTGSPTRSVTWGRPARRRDRRWNYAMLGAAVLALGYGVYAWQQTALDEDAFLGLAEQGRGVLAQVQSIPSRGRDHLSPGQTHRYPSRFPTTGPHAAAPTLPGVYAESQPPTGLVHAVEHGNIVVYYDAPGDAAMEQLRAWANLYDGQWSGLVVTQSPGLGKSVVLTAWTRHLELDAFDPAAAAAFIDAYRGRGPENPVR